MVGMILAAALGAAQLGEVRPSWDGERVAAELSLDAPVALEDVKAELGAHKLTVAVRGAGLDVPKRGYGSSGVEITAQRERDGVRVEMPIGNRLVCAGPVRLDAVAGGVRASVACGRDHAPVLPVESKIVDAPKPAVIAPAPAPVEAPKAVAVAPAAIETKPVAAPAIDTTPAAPAAPLPTLDSPRIGWTGPAVLVVLLGASAFVFAKKKSRPARMLEVVEQASLGPKRALLVVKLGGETLLLGSSEAGITLLSNKPSAEPPRAAPVAAPGVESQLGGLLARFQAPATRTASFEEVLGESTEDVELRRKLAAGLGARVTS